MRYKILYFHHSVSKSGAARSLSFLIESLDKEKYEPIVICRKDKENIQLFENVGAKVIIDPRFGPLHGSTVSGMNFMIFCSNLLKAIPTYFVSKYYVEIIKPDLVNINSTCMCIAAKGAKNAAPHTPVIVHVREPLMKNVFGNILKLLTYKNVDGYIAIDKNDMNSVYMEPIKDYRIIYNFVDFEKYNESISSDCLKKELGIPADNIVFLFLGRIIYQNGVIEMINTFANIYNEHKNYHLVIVGDEPRDKSKYIRKIRKICQSHNANIHLLPFRNDVPNVIASSDILVCPFIEPHFSRSVIEAAAIGVPSIGCNVGGVNELIIDGVTGFLFDKSKFEECSEKMVMLGENEILRKKLSKAAILNARENFNMNRNAKQTSEFYDTFLIKNNSQGEI
jgi:glycosyltransferase involved in cell wall biosynthesis